MAKTLRLEEMTLADAVEPLPATLPPDAHLGKALGTMKKAGLHEVAVVGPRGDLLGVLEEFIANTRSGHLESMLIKPAETVEPRLYKTDAKGRILLPFRTMRAVRDVIVVETAETP